MNEKALRVLEYEKIIEMLAAQCCSGMTRDAVRGLKPSRKIRWIEEELQATDEAVQVILKKGTPPLGGFYDIKGVVHLAAKEGSLTPKQLLEVAYNLASARKTEAFLNTEELRPLATIQGLATAITVLEHLERRSNAASSRRTRSRTGRVPNCAASAGPSSRRTRTSAARSTRS